MYNPIAFCGSTHKTAAQAAAAPGVAAEIPPAPLEEAQHVCRADRTPVRIPALRLMTGCNCSKDIPASEAVGAPVTSSEAEVLGASPVASPEAGCQSGRDAHALMPSVNQLSKCVCVCVCA